VFLAKVVKRYISEMCSVCGNNDTPFPTDIVLVYNILKWVRVANSSVHLDGYKEKGNKVKPKLALTSINQPTCFKQPNRMLPSLNFVQIFTTVKQPPALSCNFL